VPQDSQGNAYVAGNITVGGTVLDAPSQLVAPGTVISQVAVSGTFASPTTIATTNSYLTVAGQAYDVDALIFWQLASGTLGTTPDKLYFMWSASTANVSPFSGLCYQLVSTYVVPLATVFPSVGIPIRIRGRVYMSGATAGTISNVSVAVSSGTGSSAVYNFTCSGLSLTRFQ
jgi:hypothetical protein